MKKFLKFTCLVAILLPVTLMAVAQSPEESRTSLSLERLVAPLKHAGVTIDEPSLILVLRNEDKVLAARAALTLGKIGKGEAAKKALYEAIQDQDSHLAVSSMFALWLLGDNGWTMVGAARLPGMEGKVEQVLLVGHLAKAGNFDGWPHIVAAIKKEKWAPLALETVPAFVGKRNSKGLTINVVGDLEGLKNLSPSVAALVEERLKSIKEKNASPFSPSWSPH
jgi:hypothetical protein